MILIRGIKGKSYAKRIEKGIVDCRDILSALLQPPKTGYEYSDYYEKNLVKALAYSVRRDTTDIHDPSFLYSLLIDYYVPHIYLTYFHILNEHSLECLGKFDDDYQFIALNVKLDRHTNTAIGNEFFGVKMKYVDSICDVKQGEDLNFHVACICSMEDLFTDKRDMMMSIEIYNTLSFALLCREQKGKFTDIENEFRIIAYDCPRIIKGEMKQTPRKATITTENTTQYSGILKAGENTIFKSNLKTIDKPLKNLSTIIEEEKGRITLDSNFKAINIRNIAEDYKYLGGKMECAKFIKEMLEYKPKDIYVERTVERVYNLKDIPNAIFAPGYQKIDYK